MLNNKTFLKIISLVAAILLWAYVMGEVDPEKTAKANVTISFTNEEALAEQGLAAVVSDDMTTVALIKGKRSRVNNVKQTGLTATVDVSSCKEGENKVEISINVPDSITIESISDDYLQFEVEELAQAQKSLSVEFADDGEENEVVELGKLPWVVSVDPEEVTITGARSAVDKVDFVRGIVSSKNLSEDESKWVHVSAIAVDKDGVEVPGITIVDSEYIRAQLRIMTFKTVTLKLSEENVADGFEVDSIDIADKIQIVGPESILSDIDEIEGYADFSEITDSEINEINVYLNMPDGIYLYDRENPLTVQAKLKAAR